jgi:hypothetical protein
MTIGRTRASILVAGIALVLVTASSASAALAPVHVKCFSKISKASQSYVKSKLKLIQKCNNANLKDGSCTAPTPEALAKLDVKYATVLAKGCPFSGTSAFRAMSFPGACSDLTLGDDFSLADLQACMKTAHDSFIDQVIPLEYDATVPGPLGDDLGCQAEVAKQSSAMTICLLKNVGKCRDALLKGKPLGVAGDFCAVNDPKTSAAIQKCQDKVLAGLTKRCNNTQISTLKVCTPDQTTVAGAATCLIDAQRVLIDSNSIIVPADLIDFEYAVRGGLCGDNVVNNLNEECDGPDDSACPGECGTAETPDGFFACLCKTKPRMLVKEHADADTDNGWKGLSVDGDVVEGGGYIVDLTDCDMTGQCNAGPSCSLPPHSPCGAIHGSPSGTSSNAICAFFGQGVCRKERTATGPHCYQDPDKKCDVRKPNDPVCDAPGDFCQVTFHGAPVAAAAGGVAVCNVSTFTEDIVGTVNLTLGTSTLKVRQAAVTWNPISQDQPCPVCGDFCGISRLRCDALHPCAPDGGSCITDAVCSNGARSNQSCRRNPPFGGEIPFFGTTSVDCPPLTSLLTHPTNGGLDINANPRTTGTVTMVPTFNCTQSGFTHTRCRGGTNNGALCDVDSECPGATCSPQCYCAAQPRPNDCANACVGGGSDAMLCDDDVDCPGGFCHPADCRLNLSDTDSNQEGLCTAGPANKFCSITSYKGCVSDTDCQPSSACQYCTAGDTCTLKTRQCFLNTSIERIGTPGTPERETAGVYCVPANYPSIDISAGFPGPGALIQRESVVVVP